jgi:hypothetical protein
LAKTESELVAGKESSFQYFALVFALRMDVFHVDFLGQFRSIGLKVPRTTGQLVKREVVWDTITFGAVCLQIEEERCLESLRLDSLSPFR